MIQNTDPRKDTAPPAVITSPEEIRAREEHTRQLFSRYDLRWPDNLEDRAKPPDSAGDIYRLFATQETLMALGKENFVQVLERWAVDGPAGIPGGKGRTPKSRASPRYNLKGQKSAQDAKVLTVPFQRPTR